ncbi:hypothetical protein OG453_08440 [Streptomyces sp. NBC_01381]|uniref:hypothetical protein n=1 Tax=Streptomyces sp. NBC_01381 TaxID=2903845 RepID=UPI002254AE10|nr:hypothetical protein [Streptomyces sp. NBC_01381]MCX4666697.1 hypothetical protein [Streptomyces sp. NBC_01381]
MHRTTFVAVCLAAAATVGLTACGTESGNAGDKAGEKAEKAEPKGPFAGMSGAEIADKAVKTTSDAKSLRVAGKVTDEETGLDSMDMALDTSGKCAGAISTTDEGSMELIVPGGTVYMKYDEKFLRAQSKGEPAADTQAAVDMLADRWVKTKATSSDAKDIAGFCDLDVLLADFKDVNSAAHRGGTTTVDGTPAIKLTENDGKEKYTLYVATEGKPYLLKVDQTTGGKPESLTFSDYDKPVKTTPPTGDVLDLDELAG